MKARTLLLSLGAMVFGMRPCSLSAQGPVVLSRAALLEDAAILRQALEELHPGLYRYNSPAEIDQRFKLLERELGQDTSVTGVYLAFSRFVATIRCGHTFLNPVNQSRAVADAVFASTARVPFYFRWMGGRMVVTEDASSSRSFPPGTVVTAINGVAADSILRALMPYGRTDGSNAPKKLASLSLQPEVQLQAFDIYYPLILPTVEKEWGFSIEAVNGRKSVVRLKPGNLAERTARLESIGKPRQDTSQAIWTVDKSDARAWILRMPTWVTYNSKWDWRGFINRAFTELSDAGVPNLIIDLRGNEGGTGVGDAILAHLLPAPQVIGVYQRFTRYKRIPENLRPMLDTWDRSFDDWGSAAVPAPDRPGFFRLVRSGEDTLGTIIQPKLPRYRGKIFVLVGADNSSATFEFAQEVQTRRLGTLVGQPTGGNRRGINGGAFYFLRLPRSKIEMDLPLIGYFPSKQMPDEGLVPDMMVSKSAADIAKGSDREFEAVKRMISQSHRP